MADLAKRTFDDAETWSSLDRDLRFRPAPTLSTKRLTPKQLRQFNEEGYIKPIRIFSAEEIMRADERNGFEKIGDCGEACISGAFVIKLAAPQELQLRPVEGVAISLSVVEFDGSDGLLGREEVPPAITQPRVAHGVVMGLRAIPRSSLFSACRALG